MKVNRFIDTVLVFLLLRRAKTLGFTYARSYRDDDIIYSQFKANYIRELREKTEEFIAQLEKEHTPHED